MQRNIVLDTNCLLQIIARQSKNYFLWEGFLNGDYSLYYTTEILEEYEEILSIKANSIIASMVIEIIKQAPNSFPVDAHFHWNIITHDPDDNKFVDCAIVANADFIVSEDRHFKELENVKFPKVIVVRLEEFARMYRNIYAN
nr:putative toxin-antitoxin system toxin component, PIN family [Prevotella sp.]